MSICEQIAADPMLPNVRIGIASGEVLGRLGDVFGTTVNLASRITALAAPGCILCDEATAVALEDSEQFATTQARRRSIKGLGQVSTWTVTRAGEPPRSAGAGLWRRALTGHRI